MWVGGWIIYCYLVDFFDLVLGVLDLRQILMRAMMEMRPQAIWRAKANQLFFGKRPIAMRTEAMRLRH